MLILEVFSFYNVEHITLLLQKNNLDVFYAICKSTGYAILEVFIKMYRVMFKSLKH